MLMVPQVQIQDPVSDRRQRVACLRNGVVESLQVIDQARRAETLALYDDVRDVRDDEPCNEGWLLNADGTYSAPPSIDPEV
jgi:hypothetical protein